MGRPGVHRETDVRYTHESQHQRAALKCPASPIADKSVADLSSYARSPNSIRQRCLRRVFSTGFDTNLVSAQGREQT